MPHPSLMYGSNIAIEEKKKIIKEIGDKYKGLNFEAQSIHIFNNDGDPQDWYEMFHFSIIASASEAISIA